MTDYAGLESQIASLTDGVPHPVANLANASALIYRALGDINWAGFYLAEGGKLVLGPFQGKPACIEIPFGKGVCGTAAATGRTQLVADVREFEGHIACDPDSRSEIVVPLFGKDGSVAAVLDIDSASLSRFGKEDSDGLESIAKLLENRLFGC